MPQKVHPAPFTITGEVAYSQDYLKPSFTTTAPVIFLEKSKPKSKTKVQSIKSWLFQSFRDFCNTTSLHGFNYITCTDLSANERIFWLIITIISIIVSISLLLVAYTWNRVTPSVAVIESSHYPIWNIPFPAVTVCNLNKISKAKAMNLARILKRPPNTTEEDIIHTFRITMYFNFAFDSSDVNLTLTKQVLELNNMTISDLSQRIAPNCMEMIENCVWKGTSSRCDSLFQRINTMSSGECCTFNYFAETANNFPEKIAYQVAKIPQRVTGCGYPSGLSILINPNFNDYFASTFSGYGVRLLIHDSYNVPDENAETKVISSGRESFVHINPKATYATKDINRMAVSQRDCLFHHERKLKVLQRYSSTNCMWECRVRYTLRNCGCVPHSVPNNGTYPVCGVNDFKCVMKTREVFTRALNENNNTVLAAKLTEKFSCNCLSDCQSYLYLTKITMGKINVKLSLRKEDVESAQNNTNNLLLHIFYSDLMSVLYRREIHHNWLSSLASFGGLLGLIMGFSIVTAFEFIYFLTFRPVFKHLNPH